MALRKKKKFFPATLSTHILPNGPAALRYGSFVFLYLANKKHPSRFPPARKKNMPPMGPVYRHHLAGTVAPSAAHSAGKG
jgi:hypothetical protein